MNAPCIELIGSTDSASYHTKNSCETVCKCDSIWWIILASKMKVMHQSLVHNPWAPITFGPTQLSRKLQALFPGVGILKCLCGECSLLNIKPRSNVIADLPFGLPVGMHGFHAISAGHMVVDCKICEILSPGKDLVDQLLPITTSLGTVRHNWNSEC